jgi:dipeptidase E
MSGYFYAIGGANYDKNESLCIDLDIIKESKKANPVVLYIPVAQNDDENKINTFVKYYENLGTKVNVLLSYNNKLDETMIEKAFESSDIIYFSGGITAKLVTFANKFNLQKLLKNAYNNSKIVVGVSAGAIMFFEYGYGDKDAYTYNLETVNHHITPGLSLLNGVFCPHYQNNGLLTFNEAIKDYPCDGYALENGAALKINNEGFRIIKTKGCCAFRFLKDEKYQLEYLKQEILYKSKLFK